MDIKDVENLAELARIDLNGDEKKELLHDLKGILDYVKVVEKIEVPVIKGAEEYSQKNVWREDILVDANSPETSKFSTELIIKQFPDKQDNFLKVKKIL